MTLHKMRTSPGGFMEGTRLLASELNDLQDQIPYAIDGYEGGIYNISGMLNVESTEIISLTGSQTALYSSSGAIVVNSAADVNITGGDDVNIVATDDVTVQCNDFIFSITDLLTIGADTSISIDSPSITFSSTAGACSIYFSPDNEIYLQAASTFSTYAGSTFNIAGDCNLNNGGNIDINNLSWIDVNSGGNIYIQSGGNLIAQSGGDIKLATGSTLGSVDGHFVLTPEGAMSCTTGVQLLSTASVLVDAGTTCTLNGASISGSSSTGDITLNSAYDVNITGFEAVNIISASTDILLTAADDIVLTATDDINLIGASLNLLADTTITGSLTLNNGSDWINFTSTRTVTLPVSNLGVLFSPDSTYINYNNASLLDIVQSSIDLTPTTSVIYDITDYIPMGAVLTQVKAYVTGGADGGHAALPSLPVLTVYSKSIQSSTETTLASEVDTSATVAAYNVNHSIIATCSHTKISTNRLLVHLMGEYGANAEADEFKIYGLSISFTTTEMRY